MPGSTSLTVINMIPQRKYRQHNSYFALFNFRTIPLPYSTQIWNYSHHNYGLEFWRKVCISRINVQLRHSCNLGIYREDSAVSMDTNICPLSAKTLENKYRVSGWKLPYTYPVYVVGKENSESYFFMLGLRACARSITMSTSQEQVQLRVIQVASRVAVSYGCPALF
jgi:hypothetical protein